MIGIIGAMEEEVSLLKESNSKLQQIEDVNSLEKCYLQQLDQLKEQLEAYKMEAEEGKEINAELKAENEELKGIRDRNFLHALEEQKRANKLTQTLTEIKEIAEKIDDSDGCAYGDYDCDNCSSLEQETVCTYKVKKLILQKISEVENVGN